MFHQIFTIAKNTYLETVRDKIILGGAFATVLILLFSTFVGSLSLGQEVRVVADFGLTAVYLLQLFITFFVSVSLIQKEIIGKTIYLIIPKLEKREYFLLGKALGFLMALAVFSFINSILLSIVLAAKGAAALIPGVLFSTVFGLLESGLLIFVAMFFSLFASPLLALLFTVGVYLIGHSGSIILFLLKKMAGSKVATFALKTAYFILPNLDKLNVRNDVVYKVFPSFNNILLVVLYTVCYTAFLFVITKKLFARKEF